MKIAVVIPAHNEAKAIGSVVSAVCLQNHHCIVVDDGSVDDTGLAAARAGAEVLKTASKSGKGNALKMGFDHLLQGDFEVVIAMDGDGQHSPSDIPVFLNCFQKTNADIINGNRMLNPKGMPLVRFLTNRFMSWLISCVCRQRIADTQCGFRLIRTKVLRSITIESSDFEIETEILIKASKKGFKITSVGIQTIYSNEISKIQPVRDTLRFIAYLWRELWRTDDK